MFTLRNKDKDEKLKRSQYYASLHQKDKKEKSA
jgi:hypothetical protein